MLRIEGANKSEWGKVDPDASLPPASADDPVPWHGLVEEVRRTLLQDRTWPGAGGSNVSFTHLSIANEASRASDYADYYRHDFNVVFDGFETLP